MGQDIVLSGIDASNFRDSLRKTLVRAKPRVVGIATAFVSTDGVRELADILRRCQSQECRLVAGLDNAITHPEALYAAQELGWRIRIGKTNGGIFHPKLIVAGQGFSRGGVIRDLCCVYVGSSNLTSGGLSRNVECGLIADADGCLISATDVFSKLWKSASPATDAELRNYAARFADRARRRAVSELADLGINDSRNVPKAPAELRKQALRYFVWVMV